MLRFDVYDPNFPVPGDPMMPGDAMPGAGAVGVAGLFGVMFTVVIIGVIVTLVVRAMNVSKIVQSGNNPLTFETDLAIKAMESQTLAPEKTTQERLAELDDLLSSGSISADEHAGARAQILGNI